MAAICLGIKDADDIMAAFGIIDLAMVGEPEPAMRIKNNVVRATQAAAKVTRFIKCLDCAGIDIDTFNPAAGIILRNAVWR